MRWTEYLRTLAPGEQERLVNLLTLGLGGVARAVHLTTVNADARDVLAALAAAYDLLLAGQQILTRDGRHAADPELPTPVLASASWRQIIARHSLAEQRALLTALETAVQRAQQAGAGVAEDRDVATIGDHLRRAEEALLAARGQILALLSRATIEPAGDNGVDEVR